MNPKDSCRRIVPLALLSLATFVTLATSAGADAPPGPPASLVLDLLTSPGISFPLIRPTAIQNLVSSGDKLFFPALLTSGGLQLWASDGTATGTEVLPNICDGPCHLDPRFLGSASGVLFFVSDPHRLWRSDGSRRGTFPLLPPGVEAPATEISSPGGPTAAVLGRTLLSSACTGASCGLWGSDGTVAGTRPLMPASSADPRGVAWLTVVGDKAFFLAHGSSSQLALWKTDGTPAGTAAILPFPGPDIPGFLSAATGRLVFPVFGHGDQMWTSDGTTAGTFPLTRFASTARVPVSFTSALPTSGNQVYFAVDDGPSNPALWASDGTPAGTRKVAQLGPDAPALERQPSLALLGSRLVFLALSRLWAVDSTSTVPSALAVTPISLLVPVRGRVVFEAQDDAHGREVWTSDGTAAGTHPLVDICPGPCSPKLGSFVPLLGDAFFLASTPARGTALWRTDGTASGTRPFTDPLELAGDLPDILELAALGDRVFYALPRPHSADELWTSDGTPGTSRPVAAPFHDAPSSNPQALAVAAGHLFFVAQGEAGWGLFTSDGTAAGTALVTAGNVQVLAAAAGVLFYLLEDDAQNEYRLWRTDGTPAGTFEAADLGRISDYHGELATSFFHLLPYRGKLLFNRIRGGRLELWQSDGTVAGTVLAFALPDAATELNGLRALGDDLFFSTGSGEVWHSDGTTAGTVPLQAISGSFAQPLRIGSPLFLALDNGLYRTNGTAAGTVRATPADLLSLADATVYQGAVYFFATRARERVAKK